MKKITLEEHFLLPGDEKKPEIVSSKYEYCSGKKE